MNTKQHQTFTSTQLVDLNEFLDIYIYYIGKYDNNSSLNGINIHSFFKEQRNLINEEMKKEEIEKDFFKKIVNICKNKLGEVVNNET